MLAKHKGWTFTNVFIKESINRKIEKLDRNTILIYGGVQDGSQIMTFSKSCHEVKGVKELVLQKGSPAVNSILAQ